MKRKNILVLLLVGIFLVSPSYIWADDLNNALQNQKTQLEINQQKQAELHSKILQLQSEEHSLANQVAYLESQIQLTELEIEVQRGELENKEKEFSQLSLDIDDLNNKITLLKDFTTKLEVLLQQRIRSAYKKSQIGGGLNVVFNGKDDLQELIYRYQYLKTVQNQDSKLLVQMQLTQSDYNTQIENLKTKKDEVARLKQEMQLVKDQLETEAQSLDKQKEAKHYLLSITQNDESQYQRLYEESIAEQQAIQGAISSLINQIVSGSVNEGQQVEKGDIVGIQGSTGLSTGDHLHFGVYKKCGSYWCHTDPKPYLDAGLLEWPLQPHYISQWYGMTDYAVSSGFYSDNFHNGIDMYWDKGSPILAAEGGSVHYTMDEYGGKGALVYHSEDLMTLYWHLQ